VEHCNELAENCGMRYPALELLDNTSSCVHFNQHEGLNYAFLLSTSVKFRIEFILCLATHHKVWKCGAGAAFSLASCRR